MGDNDAVMLSQKVQVWMRRLAGTKETIMGDSGQFVEETGEKISAAGEK